ncbi:MAG: hypothetical protein IIC15_06465, partial [Thaumarchaeota archaeon]|nr:hypothetical protein [Nitrososphaerota archaeon]
MTHIFSLIAFLVLLVSVSSVFVESAYADDEDPIKMVLEITYQNILESRGGVGVIPENAETFFLAGQEKYEEALAALEAGDIEAARESALIAMALFGDSVEEIGVLEDQSLDTGITNQGFGFTAANIFEVQEEITGIDKEVEDLRELIESNNLDIDFEEYENSINLAKEGLANGDISDAQAKLNLANEIKNELYEKIDAAVKENQDERVEQFVENSIANIENILEKYDNNPIELIVEEENGAWGEIASGNFGNIPARWIIEEEIGSSTEKFELGFADTPTINANYEILFSVLKNYTDKS